MDPAPQFVQAGMFDAIEYRPAVHSVQSVAPVKVLVFVIEPGGHNKQSLSCVLSRLLWYLPALHSEHAATLDAVEYFPAVQGKQVLAPVPAPVFVIDPAAHAKQSFRSSWLAALEPSSARYFPSGHRVHFPCPGYSLYCPLGQTVHSLCTVDDSNWPFAHIVQFSSEPHPVQKVMPGSGAYFPELHTMQSSISSCADT